jgi:oligopeptide/dipeptide ABC transporter ATP-binding protein
MSNLLSVENLQVQFQMRAGATTAVDNFSLTVDSGQCVGVVGESGCGKSTTGFAIMQLLAGNGAISGGRILFEGTDLASLTEREMEGVRGDKIALIPQDPLTSLNPTTKIGRQVGEGFKIHRDASDEETTKRVLEVLEMVEMPSPRERLNQYPFELSGGLRQRVMIAMGLVCSPKLLIADEPTTALDVTIQEQILDIFDSLRKNLQMGVILITHDMGVIAGRTDDVVVMYAGRKVEQNTTEKLFATMHHPYTQALLASVPSIDANKGATLRSIAGVPPDLSKPITVCRFAPRCQYATAKCHSEDPPATFAADGSEYSCFFPVNGPLDTSTGVTKVRERTTSSTELVNVSSLTKEFTIRGGLLRRKTGAVHAVSDVSFAVYEGETFGLVGESGCGKTTTGRMIVGLETPNRGSITFQGTDVTHLKGKTARVLRRDRQMMFQDPYSSLNPRMRVGEIIREPLAIQKVGTRREQHQEVSRLMSVVGLDPRSAERHPHEFSGGQRQRIGLARALALNPKLVVADEPVSALDVSIQAQILNLMKDLQDELGVSFVFVSHDLAVVNYMADRIGVMYLGEIVEIGDADSIFRTPAHPYTLGLLNAVPLPDPKMAKERRGLKIVGELPSSANPPSGCRFRTRCPKVQEVCANVAPPMESFGGNHQAACHFPLIQPVSLKAKSSQL